MGRSRKEKAIVFDYQDARGRTRTKSVSGFPFGHYLAVYNETRAKETKARGWVVVHLPSGNAVTSKPFAEQDTAFAFASSIADGGAGRWKWTDPKDAPDELPKVVNAAYSKATGKTLDTAKGKIARAKAQADNVTPEKKRRRGRPAKQDLPKKPTVVKAEKRRGRPKKSAPAPMTATKPKKRGRPKKVNQTDEYPPKPSTEQPTNADGAPIGRISGKTVRETWVELLERNILEKRKDFEIAKEMKANFWGACGGVLYDVDIVRRLYNVGLLTDGYIPAQAVIDYTPVEERDRTGIDWEKELEGVEKDASDDRARVENFKKTIQSNADGASMDKRKKRLRKRRRNR